MKYYEYVKKLKSLPLLFFILSLIAFSSCNDDPTEIPLNENGIEDCDVFFGAIDVSDICGLDFEDHFFIQRTVISSVNAICVAIGDDGLVEDYPLNSGLEITVRFTGSPQFAITNYNFSKDDDEEDDFYQDISLGDEGYVILELDGSNVDYAFFRVRKGSYVVEINYDGGDACMTNTNMNEFARRIIAAI